MYNLKFLRLLTTTLILLWEINIGYAQYTKPYRMNKIIPSSPTAAALGKYGDIPVSFYNGTPSISIPLYDIKTMNHSLQISMQYDASGIKVAQDASWVGLGWSLSAGGVITRIVRQQDDFIEHGYYRAAALPLVTDPGGPNRTYLNNILDGYVDAEPDIYSYNFNGYSGRFVLGKSADGAPVFLDEKNNLKIEYLYTQGKWIITTGEGYKYYFSTSEGTQDYEKNTLYEATDITGVQGLNMNLDSSPITGWYLDSMVAPTGETISFTYVKGKSLSLLQRSEAFYQQNKIITTNDCGSGNLPGNSHTYSVGRQAITDVYLKTITFATGSIEFNTTPRNDIEYIPNNDGLLTPSKLDNIIIRNYNGLPLKKFSFSYSHFNTLRSNNDDIQNRLKLDAITEYSSNGVAKPPYIFSYNNPNSLPDKYSKSVDHWGYPNGKVNSSLLPTANFPQAAQLFTGADREPDTLEVLPANGVLNKIKYPTGGSTSFEYELNDFSNLHDELLHKLVNKYVEVRSNPNAPPGYNTTYATFTIKPLPGCDPNNDSDRCKIPVVISCGYSNVVNNTDGTPSLGYSNMRQIMADGSTKNVAGCTTANYNEQNPGQTMSNRLFLPGNYQMDVLSNQSWSYFMSISWKEPEETNLVQLKGGGIRVKRIVDEDAAGHTTIRKFVYKDNTGKSSGVLLTYPKYDVTYDVYQDIFRGVSGSDYICSFLAQYTAVTSNSIYPSGLGSKSGIVGYAKVIELLGENGENGKTEYNFHCQEEIRDDFPGIPIASNPFNGKMDSVKYYNAQGGILKKDNYHYSIQETNTLKGIKLFFNNTLAGDGNLMNNYHYYTRFYDNNSYWTVNDLKTETIYSGNIGHTSTTSYAFASNIHREATQTTVNKSDGSQLITKYKRPSDYTVSGNTSFAEQMTGNHVITPVVEEQTFLLKNGVTTLLSGAFTNYRKYNNLYFKPDLIYQIETNTPLSVLTESSFSSGGQPVIHPNYKPTGYNDLYDLSGGNLLSRHLYNGPSESYFWGYKNQYPIAQITGVDYNTAKQYVDTALLNNPATTQAQLQTELNKIRTGLASINAQVTTFIYDPLVGIVSSTDPKGMTTTYEYDNFLRLINVKNKDGNIVKHMDYHYQGQ